MIGLFAVLTERIGNVLNALSSYPSYVFPIQCVLTAMEKQIMYIGLYWV